MSERQLQFRVGLFVIVGLAIGVGLLFRFGEMRSLWQEYYTVAVHFAEAPGVYPDTAVRKNGVAIGHVRELYFDDRGGVTVLLNIQKRYKLRQDSQVRLMLSLLGDATVEFTPGTSREVLAAGARLEGELPTNPLELVSQMQARVDSTLQAFEDTSREWQGVARNLNGVMDTHRGNIDRVVEKAAESLHEMSVALKSVNRVLLDPQMLASLQDTMQALPEMVNETKNAIRSARGAIGKADAALGHLAQATAPLAERSASISSGLDRSLNNLDRLLTDLSVFARVLNDDDGTLKLLATDPELYRNLNRSAGSLDTLLKNLEPALADLRILSDKLARHPELLGMGGALNGSSGLKEPEEPPAKTPVRTAFPGSRSQRN